MNNPTLVFNLYRHDDGGWEVRVGPGKLPGAPYETFQFTCIEAAAEWMRLYLPYKTKRKAAMAAKA